MTSMRASEALERAASALERIAAAVEMLEARGRPLFPPPVKDTKDYGVVCCDCSKPLLGVHTVAGKVRCVDCYIKFREKYPDWNPLA